MNYQILYYILLAVLAAGSLLSFSRIAIGGPYPTGNATGRHNRYGTIAKYIKGRGGRNKDNNLFAGIGINFPLSFYQAVRYSFFGVWFTTLIVLKIAGQVPSFNLQILLCVIFFIATAPRNNIGSLKLPFFYIRSFLMKRKRQISNKEIYRTISQIINLFTLKGDKVIGSNYIFEEIIKFSKVTRSAYQRML